MLDNDERTNNAADGFHNKFSHTIEANHPCLAKFFNELVKEATFQETVRSRMEIGFAARPIPGWPTYSEMMNHTMS